MNFQLDRIACVTVSIALLAACRGTDATSTGDSASEGAESSGGGMESSGGSSLPTTTIDASTGPVDPSTTSSESGTTEAPCFICSSDGGQETSPPPDGTCMSDADCTMEPLTQCYSPPIAMGQGVCSECNEDQDCVDAGTGISCTADILSMSATCAPGELGNNCESSDACQDPLVCEPVIDGLMGFLPNSCSECADSGDCSNGQLCSPVLDMGSLSGSKQCVDPGSVPNGSLCPSDPNEGDAACMSGHCADVDVMGFLQIPVCGECEDDSDCDNGQTCMPGAFSGNGLTGSTCG